MFNVISNECSGVAREMGGHEDAIFIVAPDEHWPVRVLVLAYILERRTQCAMHMRTINRLAKISANEMLALRH